MKIAVMVDQFPSPSETFVLGQIKGILSRGHQVDVFADKAGRNSDGVSLNLGNAFTGSVAYFHEGEFGIPKNKFRRLAKALYLFLNVKCQEKLILIRSLNIFRHGMKAVSLALFYKCLTFLKNGNYDIVHCHFGPVGEVAATLKKIGAINGKLIITFHGYDITSYVKQHGPKVYETLFSTGDLFLPISDRWKAELIRLGCPREKIIVHRMGVDMKLFGFCQREKQIGDKTRILTVGRFTEKKGMEYGIRAVARVVQHYPEIEYRIVGDGLLRDKLSRLIKRLNVGEHVQLLHWTPHEEVAKLMEETDIVLAPSVTAENGDQEGISVVLMEALASGKPVLSTLHSGIPELVRNGESGFLVQEGDTGVLAEKLTYLIEHPEIWPEMGQAGRACVENHYDVNKLNDQLVSVYERILQEQKYYNGVCQRTDEMISESRISV